MMRNTYEYAVSRMLYLIAAGYPESAAEMARQVATEGWLRLGRERCPVTGQYFINQPFD